MLLALAWWVFGVTGTLRLGMVGVEVEDDYITRVLPDSPAERAGLRVGDRVAAIEGDEGMIEVGRTLIYSIERDGELEEVELQAASWHGTQRNVMLATIAMGLLHLLCGAAQRAKRISCLEAFFAFNSGNRSYFSLKATIRSKFSCHFL